MTKNFNLLALFFLFSCSYVQRDTTSSAISGNTNKNFQIPFLGQKFKTDYLLTKQANGITWTGASRLNFSSDSLAYFLRKLNIETMVSDAIAVDFYFNNTNSDSTGAIEELDGLGIRTYKSGFYIHEFYKNEGDLKFEKWEEQTFTSRSIGMGINQINAQRMVNSGVKEILLVSFFAEGASDNWVWPLGGNQNEVYQKLTAAYLD